MMFPLAIIVGFAAIDSSSVENDNKISTGMVNTVDLTTRQPDVTNFIILINAEATAPWSMTVIIRVVAMAEAIVLQDPHGAGLCRHIAAGHQPTTT